jgi:acetoin:2,6-dichlorophenolindophenol oxidoreductase subunit alpha
MTTAFTPTSAEQLEMYRKMVLIKVNDDQARKLLRSGKATMQYYSPRGQEVIPSAVSVCLQGHDYICTIYRGTHDMLAKGVPLRELWPELLGRSNGTCKGKGGPMHITHPKSGVMVTTGIVGSSMPIANGLAWASLLSGDKRVTIAYFGDGASNIGAFHESLNLASLWKLPVVFVCQNNRYAEHTAYAACTAIKRISGRAASYEMPGVTVDGNDPFAMYAVAREAIERARSGAGPTLIEALTYRFHGHHMGDNQSYIDPAELKAAMEKDPTALFRAKLLETSVATETQLAALEDETEKRVSEAIEFALASPFPDVQELRRDVYAREVTT